MAGKLERLEANKNGQLEQCLNNDSVIMCTTIWYRSLYTYIHKLGKTQCYGYQQIVSKINEFIIILYVIKFNLKRFGCPQTRK